MQVPLQSYPLYSRIIWFHKEKSAPKERSMISLNEFTTP